MAEYDTTLMALEYRRDVPPGLPPVYVDAYVTDYEAHAMEEAFDLAEQALQDGNPPVGAVLLANKSLGFSAKTVDKTTAKINGHAEIIAYENSHATVGDDLSGSTLVSTAALCSSCTPIYAEGKIARVITSAPRLFVWQLCGIMRPRNINMHELFDDGDTDTVSVINYQLERSLGLFALYGKLKGHKIPKDVDPFLEPIIEAVYAA